MRSDPSGVRPGVVFGAAGTAVVLYQGIHLFRVVGAMTGMRYTFMPGRERQEVDCRDLQALLSWQLPAGGAAFVEE